MSYDKNSSLDHALELAKKRAMQYSYTDSEDGAGGSSPKRHSGSGREIHLKLLIPSNVAGHVIGKGGDTIAELRRTSGTNIMMSKNNEHYPGTQDRVSLITGSRDAISGVVQQLVKKMKERHRELNDADTERERTVKMVVASSTIGMIIGKGGETVEQMKQRSGANILISKKGEEKTPERMITLVGEGRSNQIALDMILEKIAEDPNSGSCTNINYGASEDGIGMAAFPGYGYGSGGGTMKSGPIASPSGCDTINVNGHTNLRLTLNMMNPIAPDPWVSSQAMPHINYALRQAGHSDSAADELTRALGLLAAHGVLQLTQSAAKPEPQQHQQVWAGEQVQQQQAAAAPYSYSPSPAPAPPGQRTGLSFPRPKTPPGESSGPPIEEEVQVEERLVGAVLGPSGRHVEEIKQYSGADVQISKRGVYAPGTTNRLITIKGSPRAVKSALYLVQQKIQEKQEERARSGRN